MYAFLAVRDISVVYLLELQCALLIHLSLRPGKLAAGAAFKSYLEAPLMGPRAAAADITLLNRNCGPESVMSTPSGPVSVAL